MLSRGWLHNLFPLLMLLANPLLAVDPSVAGPWHGEIELPNGKLQVMVDLRQEGGAWKGDIDIPVQGVKDLPLEGIAVDGSKVKFSLAGIPGAPAFDGTLTGDEIRGTFAQSGLSMPFRLARGAGTAEALRRPQEPKPPFPYTAEEVAYANGDVKLAGTLTIPAGPGPFPAVLLITGSGAQDRDEAVFGHRPFLVWADHLSRNGIAVLRVDDRGVGGSGGSVAASTTTDFAQDALAGVRFLKQHSKITPERIGLIGHSEGGLVAPLAASQSPDVAFIVLLAGSGVPGREVLARQLEVIARTGGVPEDRIKIELDRQQRLLRALQAGKDPAALEASLREAAKANVATMSEEEVKTAGGAEAVIESQVKAVGDPWLRYFVNYDPRPALRRVKVPVLALNGTLDLQVIPDQNLPEIEKALKEAGNADVTARALTGLNHLFQPAMTGSLGEYAVIETTIDPAVLELVTQWIQQRFASPKR